MLQEHGTDERPGVGKFSSLLALLSNLRRYLEVRDLKAIKVTCWIVLAFAGLVQAWYTRHHIADDGLSYLDIAKNYVNGNWSAALNSYWSPLYSWLIALLLLCFRSSSYWEAGLIHLLNYAAYLAALSGFEFFLGALIRFQDRVTGSKAISEQTMRIAGYSVFLLATLLLINIRLTTPDMVASAIILFLSYSLLVIESGKASKSTYISFGLLLGLEYLARAAFAPFILFYTIIAGVLVWQRRRPAGRPVAYVFGSAMLVTLPFVLTLSIANGHFTIGEAGKLNYAWEICGAPRSVHWQGEPPDLGKPIHPTHKVLDHPATYTFASPISGTYPPWYEPSYWYAGIKPHFEWKPQLRVLFGSLKTITYIFFRSPVGIPILFLIFWTGWKRWLSKQGVVAYWFLLLPAAAYIGGYALVYLDPRYIAALLVEVWLCLLASFSMPQSRSRWSINAAIQVLSLVFAITFLVTRFTHPTLLAAEDLVHQREAEWNVNWMIADRLEQLGLRRGDRIAWIGYPMDAEWASLLGVRVVAEVPVLSERGNDLFRRSYADHREVKAFWSASPEQKARVFDAFRKAGAIMVIADEIPRGVDASGWHRVLPSSIDRLRMTGGQNDWQKTIAYIRLTASNSPVATEGKKLATQH